MSMAIGLIAIFMTLVLSLVLYFMPSIVAKRRKHPQTKSIFLFNLVLGWSVLGWLFFMIWAFDGIRVGRPVTLVYPTPSPTPESPGTTKIES